MNQTEQMLRDALQAIETVLGDAYHRHFEECCGRGQWGCCGDFIAQWTPEDRKILDTLSPIQRQLSQVLVAKPAPLVRLTEDEILECWMGVKGFPSEHTTRGFAHAIMDAMIKNNGGTQ